jgi:hypothetical protein
MAINGHARAEYALEYTIDYMSQREALGPQQISSVLRHHSGTCNRGWAPQGV